MSAAEKTSILVVDDEENMRRTLADILFDEGYDVATAGDGLQAVQMCTGDDGYGVVLMDVRMPGLDGVEALRRIRQHKKDVKVIMMSAYGVDELKQEALDAGAIAFLDKPVNVEKVIRLIGESQDTAILVVDKDLAAAAALSEALKSEDYHVTIVDSPHDALELVEQIRFDIIFVDVALPAMNGLELYLAIRQITPAAVAIMMTGPDEQSEQLACQAVRQTAYTIVRKPLELDNLLSLMRRIEQDRASDVIRKPHRESK